MERRDRDRYDRNYNTGDYDRYEGYNPNDEHYHSARNLTNEFEEEYWRESGHRGDNRNRYNPVRSYHEGSMEDAYEQRRREANAYSGYQGNQRHDRNRRDYDNNFSHDRDRFSHYRDNDREDRGMSWQNSDRGSRMHGNREHAYGVSSFDGTTSRYDTLSGLANRQAEREQGPFSGWHNNDQSSRYGADRGRMYRGGSYTGAHHHGLTDSGFGHHVFDDEFGTGRGTSFENYGTMGGNTYNRDRGNITGDNAYHSDRRY